MMSASAHRIQLYSIIFLFEIADVTNNSSSNNTNIIIVTESYN